MCVVTSDAMWRGEGKKNQKSKGENRKQKVENWMMIAEMYDARR